MTNERTIREELYKARSEYGWYIRNITSTYKKFLQDTWDSNTAINVTEIERFISEQKHDARNKDTEYLKSIIRLELEFDEDLLLVLQKYYTKVNILREDYLAEANVKYNEFRERLADLTSVDR